LNKIEHLGITIPLDETILSETLLQAIVSGKYEHKEAAELGRIVEQGERILEIGGGIGFISALCARNGKSEAIRVYEANPALIPFIHKVHEINHVTNVEVRNAVLLNSPGTETTDFYVRENFWASSLSPKPFGYKEVVSVPVRSFNAEVEQFRPTMIICDIEGGEYDLFLNSNLSGIQKVYVEIHQRVLGRKGIKAVFDAFSARNFHYDQWHSSGSVVLFSHVSRDDSRARSQAGRN
jgi:FkbM family methyltransferase